MTEYWYWEIATDLDEYVKNIAIVKFDIFEIIDIS